MRVRGRGKRGYLNSFSKDRTRTEVGLSLFKSRTGDGELPRNLEFVHPLQHLRGVLAREVVEVSLEVTSHLNI